MNKLVRVLCIASIAASVMQAPPGTNFNANDACQEPDREPSITGSPSMQEPQQEPPIGQPSGPSAQEAPIPEVIGAPTDPTDQRWTDQPQQYMGYRTSSCCCCISSSAPVVPEGVAPESCMWQLLPSGEELGLGTGAALVCWCCVPLTIAAGAHDACMFFCPTSEGGHYLMLRNLRSSLCRARQEVVNRRPGSVGRILCVCGACTVANGVVYTAMGYACGAMCQFYKPF